MNDMEKCFYEPAELSVVDEGKGCSLVKAKGSPYKLGFLVAQGGVREPQRCVRYEQRFQPCSGRGYAERNS